MENVSSGGAGQPVGADEQWLFGGQDAAVEEGKPIGIPWGQEAGDQIPFAALTPPEVGRRSWQVVRGGGDPATSLAKAYGPLARMDRCLSSPLLWS